MGLAHVPVGEASISMQKTVAIVPKFTAALSFLGSLYIVVDVFRIERSKRKMYHRILLGMSLSGCLSALAWFFTTWPIPPDVLDVWGARGTQRTCSAQGFFAQSHIAAVIYSGCLSLYYFLVIHQGWTEFQLEHSRVEWAMHAVAATFALATCITGLSLGLFNPIGWSCWISTVPLKCKESWETFQNGDVKCSRGDNATLFQWGFFYFPLWLIILGTSVLMTMIVIKFWKQEKRNRRWSNENGSSKRLQALFWQSVCFVGVFYVVWIFPTVLHISEIANDGQLYFEILVVASVFLTSHGIFHLILYLRPQYLHLREQRKEKRRQKRKSKEKQMENCSTDHPFDTDTSFAPNGTASHDQEDVGEKETRAEDESQWRSSTLRTMFAWGVMSIVERINQTLRNGDGGLGGVLDITETRRNSPDPT